MDRPRAVFRSVLACSPGARVPPRLCAAEKAGLSPGVVAPVLTMQTGYGYIREALRHVS